MSLQKKLIIPFLDDKITKEDVSPEAGFFGIYDEDKNRPGIENCIFLMYDASVKTPEANARFEKFKDLKSLRSWKVMYIDKKAYIIYAFVVINKTIEHIRLGRMITGAKDIIKIVAFWRNEEDVQKVLLFPYNHYKVSWDITPEEDYRAERGLTA